MQNASQNTQNSTTFDVAALVAKCRRQAISMGQKRNIDADDSVQMFAETVLSLQNKYDPRNKSGASPETYFLSCFQNFLMREASQARYGIELDDDENSDASELLAITTNDSDDNEQENWRFADETEIGQRVALLAPKLRQFAHRILSKNDTAEVSDDMLMTDRNGRYMTNAIADFFTSTAPKNSAQGDFFLAA